jgi:hypothetical protein
MRDLLILAIHLLVTLTKLLGPGGARQVVAESLLRRVGPGNRTLSPSQIPDLILSHHPARATA